MEVIHTGSFDADHINTIIIDSVNASTAFEENCTGSFDGDHINTIIIDSANALTTFEEKKQREKIKKNKIKRFKKNQGRLK